MSVLDGVPRRSSPGTMFEDIVFLQGIVECDEVLVEGGSLMFRAKTRSERSVHLLRELPKDVDARGDGL